MLNDNITDKDIKAACNIIKNSRKQNKINKHKVITVQLFNENNRSVSYTLNIGVRYDTVSFSHCLRYYNHGISPTINNKLECINEAGLLMLEKHRKASNRWENDKENIKFYEYLDKNIGLYEKIHYNIKTGNVSYNSVFKCTKILLRIDI